MKIFRIDELLEFVREKSPFYRELYRGLPTGSALNWEDVPILDQEKFWAANTAEKNQVMTGVALDGTVFKSGGTTGNPKFSVFTQSEWDAFTKTFGRGLSAGGLKRGERVANLFYAGELYASFIFIMKSIEFADEPALQFSLGGKITPEEALKTIGSLDIGTWAGVPTSIMLMVEEYVRNRKSYPGVVPQRILFGGENMYSDQRRRIEEVFPGVQVQSIGYASVDAGPLGYVDPQCAPGEHRVFGSETLFEIVDDVTGKVIEDPGKPGRVVFTNLIRSLMPIIRYPAGDLAEWVEPRGKNPDRKFLLLGRAEESARIGPVSIGYEDVHRILETVFRAEKNPIGFTCQLLLTHFEQKDEFCLSIATTREADSTFESLLRNKITSAFFLERPMFKSEVDLQKIHPLKIEFVSMKSLKRNPRTGKLRRVIDERAR